MTKKLIDIFWNAKFGMNAYLHSLILFSILTCFFIYYISNLTSSAFGNEITNIIDNKLTPLITNIKNENNLNINNNIFNKLEIIYKKPYEITTINNTGLFNTIILINLILWFFFIIGVLIIKQYSNLSNLDIISVFVENFLVFACVGVIEFLFFTKIAFKYVPIMPSFMSTEFLNIIKNKVQTSV